MATARDKERVRVLDDVLRAVESEEGIQEGRRWLGGR